MDLIFSEYKMKKYLKGIVGGKQLKNKIWKGPIQTDRQYEYENIDNGNKLQDYRFWLRP